MSKAEGFANEHVFAHEKTAGGRVLFALSESRAARIKGLPEHTFGGWTSSHADGPGMTCCGLVIIDGVETPIMLHLNEQARKIGRESLLLEPGDGAGMTEYERSGEGYLVRHVGEMSSDFEIQEIAARILIDFAKHIRRQSRRVFPMVRPDRRVVAQA